MAGTVRERLESEEPTFLKQGLASLSADRGLSRREHGLEHCDFRTSFHRDYTRIVHSLAFRRLRNKTQVFLLPLNDHVCTRLEHSLYVASIGRTASKALGLNNDLVAAIAVGHDLGHAPLGHAGERVLAGFARRHNLTRHFCHELHGLRVVDRLECPYPGCVGLNLTFAVRDGIACHCGEEFEPVLTPKRDKTPEDLLAMTGRGEMPATLEGCLVRMVDKVAYLGRDFEDAVVAGLVRKDDLPPAVKTALGASNREIINAFVNDIFQNSLDQDHIALGQRVHAAMSQFAAWSAEHIYEQRSLKAPLEVMAQCIRMLLEHFEGELTRTRLPADLRERAVHEKRECYRVLAQFLEDTRYEGETPAAQISLDFVAGMTDKYAERTFRELFLPSPIV
jgi:dGTPase